MNSKSKFFDKKMLWALGIILLLDIPMLLFGPRESLDMKLYYTGDQARTLFASFTPFDHWTYFFNAIFDFILISTYSFALYLGYSRIFPNTRWLWFLALAPGLFDFIETAFIFYALNSTGTYSFFDWLGIVTFSKWTLTLVVVLILAIGARLKFVRTRSLRLL